jgi:hypothetical protein
VACDLVASARVVCALVASERVACARVACARIATRGEIPRLAVLTAGLLPTLDTRSSLMSLPVAFLIFDLCSSVSLIRTSFAMCPPSVW